MAVGDIMVHAPQLSDAYYDAKTKKYDFAPWFEKVAPLLKTGDWVYGNLETPLAGADLKYTGYPMFNAPPELAGTLKDAGFQVLSTANNHTLDRGYIGLSRTLNNLRAIGLVPIGTSVSLFDSQRLTIVERNGIKLGFAAYTYGTNGNPIPKDKPYSVNLIDPEAIASDIARLRKAGADAVAVSLHFGIEYQRMPNDDQRELARKVIAAGADIILGAHPHVVQPYEKIDVPDAGMPGGVRSGFVIYSMGNFISNQHDNWKDVGVIVKLKLTKTTDALGVSTTTWSDVQTTPTWVYARDSAKGRLYTVLPLPQTVYAKHDQLGLTPEEDAKIASYLNGLNRHLQKLTPPLAG